MVENIFAWIQLDPSALVMTLGYMGIALFIFAESGVLVGMFLPGDSLLFAAGLLAAAGFLSYWPLLMVVVIAAILGDSVGYWFGARVGRSLFNRRESRFLKKEYLERTEQFYTMYGGRALILARFVPVVRTFAPILAGVGTMPYRTFLSYNVLGGLLWGAGIVSLGYCLGSAVPDIDRYLLPIVGVIILLSLLPIAMNTLRTSAQAKAR